nr:triose-phosphate isomerase [Candidatus Enterousia merdequi]
MKFIIGNWKMNGNLDEKNTILKKLSSIHTKNKIIMCLPFTLLCGKNYGINIGAQDISENINGAYTGDISGQMLKDSGVKYVLVGHSERRLYHNENNKIIKAKANAAIKNGIVPIICIGETAKEHNNGRTMSIIKKMLLESIPDSGKYIIAYEPRWAIGKNVTPSESEISSVHETIFKTLQKLGVKKAPVIYGGNVNPKNAQQITGIKNVDGVLIGRASLKSDTLLPIIKAID